MQTFQNINSNTSKSVNKSVKTNFRGQNNTLAPISLLKREMKTGDSLKFPMSPSFVHNFNTAKEVKLKQVTTFC